MNLKGKRVLVVGLGRTGEALCHFLLSREAKVIVSEIKKLKELGQKIPPLKKKGVVLEAGKHRKKTFLDTDLIVLSPGVPWLAELEAAKNKGIKIISEIELASRFLKGKIVGVTGSNGKSTTATLTHKILKEAGLQAFLAGNIGVPLISLVEQSRDDDIYVAELSSFQLKHTEKFKAAVSIVLNITPDHLDWHPSFADYYESKKKLVTSQGENDKAILNRDDPLVWDLRKEGNFKVYAFSRKERVSPGCFIDGDRIVLSDKKEDELMKISEIPLFGIHNQENVMASALAGCILGVSLSRTRESVIEFSGLEHRLEKVLTVRGIDFYNDSKATNVDAALKSIQSFDRNIILILGGRDKGGDFRVLSQAVKERVKKIILIGEAKGKIKRALKDTVPMKSVSSMKEAVRFGFSKAVPGDIILLAPACTSFDMFKNFEERGRVFKQEVLSLIQKLGKNKI